jgi:hypothetical protein
MEVKMNTISGIPKEVKNYFNKGRRKINKVIANDDYTLTITFDIKNRKPVVSTKMT